jgi:hypothetical protein
MTKLQSLPIHIFAQPAAFQTATDKAFQQQTLDNLFIEFSIHPKHTFCITPLRNERDKIKKHQHVRSWRAGTKSRDKKVFTAVIVLSFYSLNQIGFLAQIKRSKLVSSFI